MDSSWTTVPAEEFCTSVRDGTHDSPRPVENGKLLVTTRHLRKGRLDLESAYRISVEDFEDVNRRSKVDKWDVLVSMIGTIGEVYLVDHEPDFAIKNIGLFKSRDEARGKWLYYYLCTPRVQGLLRQHSRGTTQQYVPLGELRKLPVAYPTNRKELERIVTILSHLDDKIELNRRMSEMLGCISRALFQEWVIDRLKAATSWDTSKWGSRPLDDIAYFLNGAACQRFPVAHGEPSLPVIKIRELNQGITPQSDRVSATIPQKWHIQDGDVLFSWSGTLLARIWTGGEAALNQHLFKVTSEEFPKWFYFHWVLHHLDAFRDIAADKATTMGHIRRHHLSEAICFVPDADSLENMSRVMEPLLERQILCELESRTLAELRDALLPKLISGELRVPEAEQLVSEVA